MVRRLSVVHGRVTCRLAREADYVDLRRAALHRASALIGGLMRELTADWDYSIVGGAWGPIHADRRSSPGRPIGAFT